MINAHEISNICMFPLHQIPSFSTAQVKNSIAGLSILLDHDSLYPVVELLKSEDTTDLALFKSCFVLVVEFSDILL
jgi:hypothetical protein